jgi:membrane-bound lytic murein transglycosylase A
MRRALAAALLACAALAGCVSAPPPALRLERASFHQLPGWDEARLDAALASFRRSCAVLRGRADTAAMTGAGYGGRVADWRAACVAPGAEGRSFFEAHFTPFAVLGVGDGLFTGYYEPQIRVSRSKGGAFQTPIYGLPPDLVRADLGAFVPALKGQHITGRLQDHSLVPYGDRAAIAADGIAAPPLLYTDDPVALFFLQIQGSGRALLPDGTVLRLAYAGDNGRPYTAIGRVLIEQGALTREAVSLQSIRAWLKAHPERAQAVMDADRSYVFFREAPLGDPALGSPGTLGVPLTPQASLAVDARLHPLGAPFYVAADGPDPFRGLTIAQDTGGAIAGAVRGDIFFGFGPEAERRAGQLKAPGHLFVLLPNTLAARLGQAWSMP